MIAGSIKEVLDQMEKDKKEFERGYKDFIKENQISPYEQGRAAAQRDLLERQQNLIPNKYYIFFTNPYLYPISFDIT